MGDRKGLWRWWLLFNLAVAPLALQGIHSADTDTFYHLAGGRWMATHHRILDREVFSFTLPNAPWTNYHWLFEYLLFRLYAVGGLTALVATRAILVLATANLLFALIYRRTRGDRLVTLTFALAAYALYIPRGVNIRPHLFSYLFLVVALILLERFERRPDRFEPWLPLLCVLWANLHGVEYPVLLAVVVLYGMSALGPYLQMPAGAALRQWGLVRWAILVLLCTLAFVVNPFGVGLLRMPLMALDPEVMDHVAEMLPVDWRTLFTFFPSLELNAFVVFRYALLLAVVFVPLWVVERDVRALLLVALGAALALRRARFVTEFGLIALPAIAAAAARLRDRTRSRPWLPTAALLAFAAYLVLAVAGTTWSRFQAGDFQRLSARAYPIGPVRLLQDEGLSGNLLSEPGVAGYVEWMLYPRIRVAMDMRTPEPFDAQTYWRVRVTREPAQLRRLESRWPVDFVLLHRSSSLARSLRDAPDSPFRLTYADDRFVLFARAGRLADGREHLVLTRLDPFDTTMEYLRALAQPRETVELRREIERLLRVWPENHLAYRTELVVLLVSGGNEVARDLAGRLIAEFPRNAWYAYYAGLSLKALKDDAAALALLERAVRLDPSLDVAYAALGDTALRVGRYAAARAAMEGYARRKHDYLSATEYGLLAGLRRHTGDLTGAEDAYDRALWLTPDEGLRRPELEVALAGVYLDLGQPARALPLLDAALRHAPRFPEAEFARARAWVTLGRGDEARAVFGRLADDPSAPADLRAAARARLR